MTSPCPPIDTLDDADPPATVREHLAECEGCRAVAALHALRAAAPERHTDSNADCARFEPAIAAMIDGTLDAASSTELVEHLARCAGCNETAAALSLVRDELPALEGAPPAPRTPGTRWWQPRSAGGWAAQLALVAAFFLLVGYLVAPRSTPSAEPVTSDPARTASAAVPQRPASPVPAPTVVASPDTESSSPAPHQPAEPTPASSGNTMAIDPFNAAEPTPAPADDAVGHLTVACRPLCDRVEIDGRDAGPSPVVRERVSVGKHVVVGRRGDRRKRLTVSVQPGRVSSLMFDLTDAKDPFADANAYISVACSPHCDQVLIDGKDAGSSPVARYRTTPGSHVVTTVRGNVRKTQRVKVEEGVLRRLHVQMGDAGQEKGFGRVSVTCSPACESILVDGRDAGPSPLVRYRVAAGTRVFTFVRGAERKTRRIEVKAGTIMPIRVLMAGE